MKSRMIRVSEDFSKLLEQRIEELIADCEVLGIKRKVSRVKATRLLTKRMIENGEKLNLKLL